MNAATLAARRAGNLTPDPCVIADHLRSQADMEAARICRDAGITPEELAADAKSFPELAPVAAAMTEAELVAVP